MGRGDICHVRRDVSIDRDSGHGAGWAIGLMEDLGKCGHGGAILRQS